MKCAVILSCLLFATPAYGHAWYSKKIDPVFGQGCCGIHDCGQLVISPGVLSAEEDGYRIRLTLEQSKLINPLSTAPIDGVVPWNRVQPSEDGNYHICIMSVHRDNIRAGIYCLFVPPNG
jgi:hypothetical protein